MVCIAIAYKRIYFVYFEISFLFLVVIFCMQMHLCGNCCLIMMKNYSRNPGIPSMIPGKILALKYPIPRDPGDGIPRGYHL